LNHVELNLADAGKHKWLTMPRQTFPQPAPGLTELLVYVGLEPNTNLSQLYLKRDTDGAADGVPMTARGSGYTYLPSGLLVKWGIGSTSNYFGQVGNAPILFPGPPVFAAAPTILVSQVATDNTPGVNSDRMVVVANGSVNTTQFGVNCFRFSNFASTSTVFSWIAIGLPA